MMCESFFLKVTSTRLSLRLIDMFNQDLSPISIPLLALSAIIPAFLVSVLIIMESHLTGVLVNKPTHRLVKGTCDWSW